MPTSSAPDDTPAWIKGDLPAETTASPSEPSQAGGADGLPAESGPNASAAADEATAPEQNPATPQASGVYESVTVPEPVAAAEPVAASAIEGNPEAVVTETTPPPDGRDQQPGDALLAEPATAIEPPAAEPLSLAALLESLLFVADGAVPVGRLAEALEVPVRDVEAALAGLSQEYKHRGLSLQRIRDKVQLTTSASAAAQVERFLGLAAATPLSKAALETLAIVAYQQPVTRPQIEAVRGVNSDSVIKNLLSKGLIEELGRAEGPGRPVLYSTTPEFMQHFGLSSLADLPPLALPGPESPANPERIHKG